MRALIIVAGASLTLAACGGQSVDENAVNGSGSIAAEAIISNDTTAIDPATGDAVNMAADVDYTISNSDGGGDVGADGSVDRRTTARRERTEQEPAPDSADSSAPMETAADTNEI